MHWPLTIDRGVIPVCATLFANFRTILLVFVLIGSCAIAQLQHRTFNHVNLTYSAADTKTAIRIQQIMERQQPRITHLLGITNVDSVNIWVAASRENFSYFSNGLSPDWAAAVYLPRRRRIVVKSPRWEGSLPELEQDLIHELIHHYLFATLDKRIPVWYHEGLAQWLSGQQLSFEQAVQLSLALATNEIIPLNEIDSVVTFHRQRAQLAYIQSLSAAQFLTEQLGAEQAFSYFHRQIQLTGWENAVQNALGIGSEEFEIRWYRSIEDDYRWLALFNEGNMFWLLLVMLALAVGIVIRVMNRRKLNRWLAEEQVPLEKKSPDDTRETDEYGGQQSNP